MYNDIHLIDELVSSRRLWMFFGYLEAFKGGEWVLSLAVGSVVGIVGRHGFADVLRGKQQVAGGFQRTRFVVAVFGRSCACGVASEPRRRPADDARPAPGIRDNFCSTFCFSFVCVCVCVFGWLYDESTTSIAVR